MAAGAAAVEHERLAASSILGVFEVARMHFGAGERVKAGQLGRVRNAAHAGREDQGGAGCAFDPLAAVRAASVAIRLRLVVIAVRRRARCPVQKFSSIAST